MQRSIQSLEDKTKALVICLKDMSALTGSYRAIMKIDSSAALTSEAARALFHFPDWIDRSNLVNVLFRICK